MILVILGTQDKSFDRLLKEVDHLIDTKKIKEPVIAQIGYTPYKSKNMELHKFIDKEQLQKYEKEASYIICHAGVGTIMENINLNKKLIVVPRLKKYKEHTNDHQVQILDAFVKENYVISCYDVKELENKVKQVKEFEPASIKDHNNQLLISLITQFIDKI